MDKYQEYQKALESICNRCFGDEPKKILQELVDQTKTPTLEEVIKEWEELGYYFTKTTDNQICLHTKYNGENIILELSNYTYVKYDNHAEPMDITLQEHQLLTKTFKALGW